jgi:hypothetical protein
MAQLATRAASVQGRAVCGTAWAAENAIDAIVSLAAKARWRAAPLSLVRASHGVELFLPTHAIAGL